MNDRQNNRAASAENNATTPPTEPVLQPIQEANYQRYDMPKKRVSVFPKLLFLIFLTIAGGAAYMYYKNHRNTPATNTQQSTNAQTNTPKTTPGPQSIIYTKTSASGATTTSMVFSQPINGTPEQLPVAAKENIGAVYQNMLILHTETGIKLSTNGGKSFKTLYPSAQTNSPSSSTSEAALTVTSSAFSEDHTKVVFASIGKDEKTNTVREIDIASGETKELFTSQKAGLFLLAYDSKNHQIWYTEGCYFCDGNTDNIILQQDVTSKSITTVHNNTDSSLVITNAVLSKDHSHLLYIQAKNEFLGGSPPYTLQLTDIASGSTTTVATSESTGDNANLIIIGRTQNDSLYYTLDNAIYVLDATTYQPKKIATSDKRLNSINYIGADSVIATIPGPDPTKQFSLVKFDINNNTSSAPKELLTANYSEVSLNGITWVQ